MDGRAVSSIVQVLSSIGDSDKCGGELVTCLPPSLRELLEKQQRTSREADVETGQINGACQGTVPALSSILKRISCHTQCVTLNPLVPFVLALLQCKSPSFSFPWK